MSSKKEPTPVYAKASRWYIYFRSIFPILFGLGLAGYGAYDLATNKRIPYEPTDSTKVDGKGQVMDVQCEGDQSKTCNVNVKYIIGGSTYQSNYSTPSSYKKGDLVDVYVNTNNHSQILLIGDEPTLSPWIFVVVGALFVLIPIINIYFVSKSDTLATAETIFSIAGR